MREGMREARINDLPMRIKTRLPSLEALLAWIEDRSGEEDRVYRFLPPAESRIRTPSLFGSTRIKSQQARVSWKPPHRNCRGFETSIQRPFIISHKEDTRTLGTPLIICRTVRNENRSNLRCKVTFRCRVIR
jgi:hypothetical protein